MDTTHSSPRQEFRRNGTTIPARRSRIISPSAIALSQQFSKITRPLGRWGPVKVHALLVCMIASTLLLNDPGMTMLIGGMLVTPAFVLLGFLEARRSPLWFNPLSFYLFWNSIGLGLSAIYISWRIFSDKEIAFSVALVSPEDFAAGYVIYLLGSMAMHIGLQLAHPVSQDTDFITPAEPEKHALQWLLALWVLGLLYQWKYAWFGFLGTLAKPLQWSTLAVLATVFILPREHFGFSREGKTFLVLVGTAILVVANARSGSKAYIMFSFLPLIWMMVLRPRIRRWSWVAALALSLTYFFAVEPFITAQRAHNEAAPDSESSRIEAFLMRQLDCVPTGYFVGEVRDRGFKLGQTMEYAKYAFLPRLFWPDKPKVTRGAWFTTYLGFSPREEESTTSTGITAAGELYWNFGILGVVVGMFILGAGYGLLWKMAGKNPVTQPLHMLLYVNITFSGMVDMPEAVTIYASLLSFFLVFGWLFIILKSQHWIPDRSFASTKLRTVAGRR